MKALLFENLGWKLLSLALAFLLWLSVAGESELTETVFVPVQYKGMPRDIEISSELPDRVRLELSGPAAKLGGAQKDLVVVLDCARIQGPGQLTLTITEDSLDLPSGVILIRALPSQIRLTLERKVRRQVPVGVRFGAGPPAGYRVVRHEAQPDRIWVVGPESRVNRLEQVEADALELRDLIASRDYYLNTYVNDPYVRIDGSPAVKVTVAVERSAGK